ncbi:MAG: hypothetical protein PVI11_03565 [Candidatus Aminicenantes bacterium]|jgi:DNA-binding MarR family transcriptional regulator
MDSIIDFLFGWINNIHDFLEGLNIMNSVFLILLLVILVWLFITNRRVKRVIRDPLKKYDKDVKKKQKELDRERVSIKAYVEKEVEKVRQVQNELKAQVEEEIQAVKVLPLKKRVAAKKKAGETRTKKKVIPDELKTKMRKIKKRVVPKRVEQPAPGEIEAREVEEIQAQLQTEEAVPEAPAPQEPEEEVSAESKAREEMKDPLEKRVLQEQDLDESEREEISAPKEKANKSKKDAPGKIPTEQFFILSAIGDEPDKTMQEDAMFKTYQMAFEEKTKEDFDYAVKKLEERGFVTREKPSGYRVWIKITDEGLEYYQNSR